MRLQVFCCLVLVAEVGAKEVKDCCGISSFLPRYKRLVDNIFPVNPQEGLVKSNMEKLMFYSLSSPEKLDRIGEYLFQRVSHDISRKKNGFVVIAAEAMEQLLVACHAQTLNLFVESFLKMIQKLLESSDVNLQILATQLFVRFANIEEDTPSYHRRYDFFVSKFSSMCHNDNMDLSLKDKIRLAGIKGLQGVVRKTVSDDLVENIWDAVHMNKIVPSLLYNMHESENKNDNTSDLSDGEKESPSVLAESCLRELIGRVSFGHIDRIMKPVLQHLDLHELWIPNKFAVHTFKLIVFSIQAQYSCTVIETLMEHLEKNSKSTAEVRRSIADVLKNVISAAGESIGPSVLKIVNSLLNYIRLSATIEYPTDNSGINAGEEEYQEVLISTLGEFSNSLPDYQKVEVMMYIMSKIPFRPVDNLNFLGDIGDVHLQNILLKCLLKVAVKYETVHYGSTFPVSFLDPLLKMLSAVIPDIRLLAHKILNTLIDRHGNSEKLLKPTLDVEELELVMDKCSRADIIFIHKHDFELYQSLCRSLEQSNNTVDNFEAIYTTIALICIELISEDTVASLLQFFINVQDMAFKNESLSTMQKSNIHAILISLLAVVCHRIPIPSLTEYAEKMIANRRLLGASHLLPDLCAQYDFDVTVTPTLLKYDVFLDPITLTNIMHDAGFEVGSFQVGEPVDEYHEDVDDMGSSGGDFNSLEFEVGSVASSLFMEQKEPKEDLTFESMKKVLVKSFTERKKEEQEQRLLLSGTFRTAAFNELITSTQTQSDTLRNKLNEIFSKLSPDNAEEWKSPHFSATDTPKPDDKPSYEIYFPEMFIY